MMYLEKSSLSSLITLLKICDVPMDIKKKDGGKDLINKCTDI